jgi:hypothetical protein
LFVLPFPPVYATLKVQYKPLAAITNGSLSTTNVSHEWFHLWKSICYDKNWLRQQKGNPGCAMGKVGEKHSDLLLQKAERTLYKFMLTGVELP